MTNKASFSKVQFWVDELLTNEENCNVFIAGTKLDLVLEDENKRAIPKQEVIEYAKTINAQYFETSAKSGEGIELIYEAIAKKYSENNKSRENQEVRGIELKEDVGNSKKGCCSK